MSDGIMELNADVEGTEVLKKMETKEIGNSETQNKDTQKVKEEEAV